MIHMPTHPKTTKSYDEHADKYNEHVINSPDAVYNYLYEKPAMRAELPDLSDMSVISIGCGTGIDISYLKGQRAKRVVGIDISAGMVDVAKRSYPDIEFHVMDMERLEFNDETFDLAYSSLTMHYVDSWTTALKETRRVLKPNAQYIFSCHHPIQDGLECFDDGATKGSRLGKTVVKATKEQVVYGDYLSADYAGIRPVDKVICDMELRVYQKPISKMIEEIRTSGFSIEKLVEPQPLESMRGLNANSYEKLKKIPSFMIWVLQKS